jgi:hypothetical protein
MGISIFQIMASNCHAKKHQKFLCNLVTQGFKEQIASAWILLVAYRTGVRLGKEA